MLNTLVITVDLAAADITGHTNREIQAAVDRAAAQGGGIVRLGAGTYDMEDSLHLRSGVRVVGEGERTILRKRPSVSSPSPPTWAMGITTSPWLSRTGSTSAWAFTSTTTTAWGSTIPSPPSPGGKATALASAAC